MTTNLIPRALLLSVCLVVSAVVLTQASRSEPVPLRLPLEQLPMQFPGWRGVRAPDLEPNVLQVLGVSEYLSRVYRADGSMLPVGLYIGYYQSQRQGETMHSPMNCLPGSGWQPVSSSKTTVPFESRDEASMLSSITINRYVVEKGDETMLVYYWYQSHGRVIASEYWGKIYTVIDALRMNRTDAALVRVIVPVVGHDKPAEVRAETVGLAFVRKMFPQLTNHLPL